MIKRKLREICKFQSGGTPSKAKAEYFHGNIPWISTVALNGRTINQDAAVAWITEKAIEESAAKIVPAGSVMVGTRVGVGKVAVNSVPMSTSQDIISLVGIDETVWNTGFLCKFLQSKAPYLQSQARGATIKGIKIEVLENLEVPALSVSEQNKAVQNFETVLEILSTRRAQLSLLDELVKARFVEMFGDPVTNPKRLPLDRLSNLGSLERGRSKHRPRNDPRLLNGPYPLIQTGEVAGAGTYLTTYQNTYSELGLQQSKLWKAGTLCITIAANIAQTAILTFDACFPDSVVGFLPNDKVDALYMHYWFTFFQKVLEEQAPQVAQKNINLKILSDLQVMLPPDNQRKNFATFVSRVETMKSSVEKALVETQVLFDSLMQEYFG